jgi:hypothetical protein
MSSLIGRGPLKIDVGDDEGSRLETKLRHFQLLKTRVNRGVKIEGNDVIVILCYLWTRKSIELLRTFWTVSFSAAESTGRPVFRLV